MARPIYNLTEAEWEGFKVKREERQSEHWRIKNFEIDDRSAEYVKLVVSGRDPGLGSFTALHFRKEHPDYPTVYQNLRDNEWDSVTGWIPMMSDTRAEIFDHYPFLDYASWGDAEILITGLGLGMVAEACLAFGNRVTVIERDPEVIALIADQIEHPDLRIIQADALTWQPDRKFDLAWHDIWPTITMTNLPDMRRMRRKYKRHVRSWQGFWGWEQCLHMERMELRTDPTGVIRFMGKDFAEQMGREWLKDPEHHWQVAQGNPFFINDLTPRQVWSTITGQTPPGERRLP